jgi:4-amino-4-deoxy-L-arabinose transferase-like glycosyltransferase
MKFVSTKEDVNFFSSITFLVIICTVCLAPFLNKAFHIDDPLFLWVARQIQSKPFDFFGFSVNWYGVTMAMFDVTRNPPLCSYYIAFVTALFGWSEITLHVAFLFVAVVTVVGTYCLAMKFCKTPLIATLASMLTPVFLVSSTSIMCDTMMLGFWVWAVYLWVYGTERKSVMVLSLASFLIAVAALTKYYGVVLLPLLLAYSLLKKHKPRFLLPLFIPVIILLGYEWATHLLYGEGMLEAAALHVAPRTGITGITKILVTLSFFGGCIISVLFYSPLLFSRRLFIMIVTLTVISVFLTYFIQHAGILTLFDADVVSLWGSISQLCLFITGGVIILALSCMDFWENRDASSLLLFLWVVGTFVFVTFFNWTVNGRTILPMTPAVGILLMRRIEQGRYPESKIAKYLVWPLIPAAFIALIVTSADYKLADTQRAEATLISNYYKGIPGTIWFVGHWGFQYYMEALGGRAVDYGSPDIARGDIMVLPSNNTNVFPPPANHPYKVIMVSDIAPVTWISTFADSVGAGFYTHLKGPLPFAFGPVPAEQYRVLLAL